MNFVILTGLNEAEAEKLAVIKDLSAEMGVKIGFLMWPIRTAVSGKQNTPGGATEIMEIIGKEETLMRIRAAIELLTK